MAGHQYFIHKVEIFGSLCKCCNSATRLVVVYELDVLHLSESYELYVRSKEKY